MGAKSDSVGFPKPRLVMWVLSDLHVSCIIEFGVISTIGDLSHVKYHLPTLLTLDAKYHLLRTLQGDAIASLRNLFTIWLLQR